MRHNTAQLFFSKTDASTEHAIQELTKQWSGLRHTQLGRNIEGSWGAGTYTWDLWWDDAAQLPDVAAAIARVPGFERIDQVTYESIGSGVREPDLRNGTWRTLMLRVRPEASKQHIAQLEKDLLGMPEYMAGIRNWNLARVTSNSVWTHVWQQEYAQLGDLLGEYLLHPFHWGFVDRWFDPEFPEWTVQTTLSHAFCPFETSLLRHS
jgi:hypothetical protein